MTTATRPTTNGVADAPADACRFRASAQLQFADTHDTGDLRPFRMTARSNGPIVHEYWGRIVHDFDGMELRKESCPVDYCHRADSTLGFADQFSTGENGLEVAGSLIVLQENDEADRVYKRGKAGFPYEASIDWIGPETEIEWIPEDVSTEVNGQQFEGPGYVVRKWPLRALAICPYGADSDTETKFSDTNADNVSVRVFTQSPDEDENVSDETKTKTTETKTAPDASKQHTETKPGTETPTTATPAAGSITPDTLKQFNESFGDKAMDYLTAGLSFDAARLQFADHRVALAEAETKQFEEQVAERDKQLAAANELLKQFGADIGQETPVDTPAGGEGGSGGAPAAAKLFSGGRCVRKQS